MSIYKIPLGQNVLEAALERITWTLEPYLVFVSPFPAGRIQG